MQEMIKQRAQQQISFMTAQVEARRDQEIARLQQQQTAMAARIEQDSTMRKAQVEQTANAAEQRRRQAELARDLQQRVPWRSPRGARGEGRRRARGREHAG